VSFRLNGWRPAAPPLPPELEPLVCPEDPIPEDWLDGPLPLAVNHIGDFDAFVVGVALHRAGEPTDRMAFGDTTRPTTAVAAFLGGVVPDDVP
jgi:hypothetical protein